jgi:hypothetical protein
MKCRIYNLNSATLLNQMPVSPDGREIGTSVVPRRLSTTKQPPHSDFFAQKVPKVPPRPVNSLISNELQSVGLSKKVSPKSHKSHRTGNVSRWSSGDYIFFYKLNTAIKLKIESWKLKIRLRSRKSWKGTTAQPILLWRRCPKGGGGLSTLNSQKPNAFGFLRWPF